MYSALNPAGERVLLPVGKAFDRQGAVVDCSMNARTLKAAVPAAQIPEARLDPVGAVSFGLGRAQYLVDPSASNEDLADHLHLLLLSVAGTLEAEDDLKQPLWAAFYLASAASGVAAELTRRLQRVGRPAESGDRPLRPAGAVERSSTADDHPAAGSQTLDTLDDISSAATATWNSARATLAAFRTVEQMTAGQVEAGPAIHALRLCIESMIAKAEATSDEIDVAMSKAAPGTGHG